MLPARFEEYIASACDRLAFLQDYLSQGGVSSSVINVAGRKHLYVNFPVSSYDPFFKIKTIICHYDRVEGSPGANDNSAANFAAADFAIRLMKEKNSHNIRIFFTDGEELGESGVKGQGAFSLAELFRKCSIAADDVFVFDACGRGTVPVLAQTGLLNNAGLSFRKKFASLFSRTQEILKSVSPESWMTLPVPYSDNAGFLALGIPAVAVTFLPRDEATYYYKNLMREKNLAKAVMNMKLDDEGLYRFKYQELFPDTWRLFHTEYDNALSLTPESFDLLAKILDAVKALKTPA